jgi:hypothetical protein
MNFFFFYFSQKIFTKIFSDGEFPFFQFSQKIFTNFFSDREILFSTFKEDFRKIF